MVELIECPHCCGGGRQHSPGRNGDPMDSGVACERCEGEGVIEFDHNDEIEDWMADE